MNYESFEETNIEDVAVDNSAVADVLTSKGTNILHQPGEFIFGALAAKLVSNGWSVFPQEMKGESRAPAKLQGRTISQGFLRDELPSAEILDLWIRFCARENVALVFGPAAQNAFAIDIDVLDADISYEITLLAEKILGKTEFKRVGKAPKIALFYRHEEGDSIANISRKFKVEGSDEEHGIEILSAGKQITIMGRHHSTGEYFKWIDPTKAPLLCTPADLPITTSEKISEFMVAVDELYKFSTSFFGAGGNQAISWGSSEGVRIPSIKIPAEWSLDASGKLIDNREEYLRKLVWATIVLGNGEAFHVAKEGGNVDEYKANIAAAVMEEFASKAAATGRWSIGGLNKEVNGRVNSIVSKALAGPIDIKAQPPKVSSADSKREIATITIRAGEITEAVNSAEQALINADLGLYQRSGKIVSLGYTPIEVSSGGEISGQAIMEKGKHGLLEEMLRDRVPPRGVAAALLGSVELPVRPPGLAS